MASSILLSNCQIVEIQRQTNSMSPIHTSTPINQTKLKRCTCCPYGYHIDLDFIRYCEELANNSEKPTNEQLERRNKRRQRKSLEVMLGFNEDWYSDYERSVQSTKQQELSFQTIYEDFDYLERKLSLPASSIDYDRPSSDLIPTQHATTKKPVWKNSMAQNDFVDEVLFDVYKDFLRTLENTSTQTKYEIQTENDVHHDEVSNYLTATSSHLEKNVLIESSCQKQFETIAQYEMDDELPTKCLPTIDASTMKIDELTQENRNLTEQLHIVRSQLTDNLNRVRQFEERVKLIPKLELQLSVEQVENRDLHLKLTNLEIMLKEKEKEIIDKERIEMIQKTKSVKLESFTDRFSQLNEKVIVPTQDASCSTTRTIFRDVGVLTVPTAVTTNTIATNTENEIKNNKPVLKSIAIQCDSERKIETKNSSTSTMRPPQNESIGIMAMPAMSSQFSTAKPETKSIGIECVEKKIEKRSIGTNPIEQQQQHQQQQQPLDLEKSSISLKLSDLDAPRKILIQHPLDQSTKKEFKSIGIQYSTNVSNKFSQCQILPVEMPKVATKSQSTTTNDLTLVIHRAINTDSLPTTKSRFTNTDTIVTTNKFTNTDIDQQSISTKSESEQDIRKRDEHQCHNCLAKIEIKQRTIIASPKKTKFTDATDSINKLHVDDSAHAAVQHQSIISKPTTRETSESSSSSTKTTTTTTRSNKKITRQNTYTISADEEESSQKTNATVTSSCPCPAEFIISQNACTKTSSVESPNAESHHVISDTGTATSFHHETTSQATASTSESTTTIRQHQTADTDSEVMKLWGPSMKSPSTYSQLASSSRPRQKVKPSKEMQSALKVINDSLQKGQHLATTLKNANKIVQKEWFRISSTEDSQPFEVEDYLDCFEEYSPNILKYVVNLTDANGNTAMHYAVSHGNFDIVSILLDSKVCEINNPNNAGYTCVMLVSLVKLDVTEHCSVVKRLFQIADVNIRAKKHSQTALMLATSHGNYHMVRMLLEAGADINIQDEDGSTALMCAAEHGRMDIIKILLAHPECDSTIQDLDGSTALKISLDAGYRDIGVLLYAHEYMIKNKSPYASLQSAGAISRKHSTSLSSSQNVCVPSVISNNNAMTNKEGGSTTNKETCES